MIISVDEGIKQILYLLTGNMIKAINMYCIQWFTKYELILIVSIDNKSKQTLYLVVPTGKKIIVFNSIHRMKQQLTNENNLLV